VEFEVPSRALIGFRSEFLTSTRGLGLLNTEFLGLAEWAGPMMRRANGAIVADRAGECTPYALFHLQPRGEFFVGVGAPVYEGMIIGEHNRPNDSDVNIIREKKLSNVRNHGKDDNVMLYRPRTCSPSRPPWSGSTATSSSRSRPSTCACARPCYCRCREDAARGATRSRAANSTTAVSRKGQRTSSAKAIDAMSTFALMSSVR
jgi:hypothetical protein